MVVQKIDFQPGIDKETSQASDEGRWFDANRIRWRQGRPETIGGWVKYVAATIRGVCRAIHDWATQDGSQYVAFGTHLKLYVETSGVYSDVTPIRSTVTLGSNPIGTTSSSTTVAITDAAGHGAVENAFVTLSGVPGAVNGIPASELNAEHQITSVTSATVFEITVTTAATSTGSGGGAAVQAEYQINPGLTDFVEGTGFGAGGFGSGGFGSSSSLDAESQIRIWFLENFGEDLLANVRGSDIYYWDTSVGTGSRAESLSDRAGASNPPTKALQIAVSEEGRHVIAYGANAIGSSALDPLFVRWSDSESAVDWTPTATNSAGGVPLSVGSQFLAAVQAREEFLIFTDGGIVLQRFTGDEFVFSFTTLIRSVTVIGPNAAVEANNSVYFMANGLFWVYDGALRQLDCTVREFVFNGLNQGQRYKVFAATHTQFPEVFWFYPTGTENDRYVSYNYAEDQWSIGEMARGAYIPANTKQLPIGSQAASDNTYIYSHETGYDADEQPMGAYIESSDVDIEDGDQFMYVGRVLPEVTWLGGNGEGTITLKGRRYPNRDVDTSSAGDVTATTDQVDTRFRARSMVFRFGATASGFGWRLGDQRFDMQPDGKN